jgi:putative aminopeptidase FrvX
VSDKPWTQPLPDDRFDIMRQILAAPSPVGLESAMTEGVLAPYCQQWMPKGWALHRFKGNAALVLDSHPGREDLFSVMIVGHADKIRMQVRSVGEDGKIWIDSDSFLPATLIGHEVSLFSEDPLQPGAWRRLDGGTVEAIGAIHFADTNLRAGKSGIKPEMLYLELQLHGEKKRKQVEDLGIRSGDPILLHRPIRRGFAPDTFVGAYLDNGLGCFVAAEVARLIAERGGLQNVRLLSAFASHEEIGRMGSRVLAAELRPDALIAVDVAHDYAAAPGVGDQRFPPIAMGKGLTLSAGAIVSAQLNAILQRAALSREIPLQLRVAGRDTGTDAMAAVFASIDAPAASVGFPIRNMHTISESGHTGDVLASIHALAGALADMDAMNDGHGITADDFRAGHPRLDLASTLTHGG